MAPKIEPDPRKVQANRFKDEPTSRGLVARMNLQVTFPFEDFFIAELQRGTDPGEIVGVMIVQFGELIGISCMNLTQSMPPPETLLMSMRAIHEINIKSAEMIMLQRGVKKRPAGKPANDG